ncbi:MAG: hypothetical protein WA137_00040 [Methanothrix sp.]
MAVLIAQAVEKAVQPLQERISSLESKLSTLEKLEEVYHGPAPQPEEISLVSECWEKKRRMMEDLPSRIWALEEDLSNMEESRAATRTPQPMQKDRADILRALLVANGGKMLTKDARKKMHIKKNHFAELLRVCDFAETKPFHLDRRQTVIILKSELVQRD